MLSAGDLRGPELPASEQVRRWIENPIAFWEACAREHGSLVALELGSLGPVVLVSDPRYIKEIFQLPRDSFECRQYNEQYRFVMGDKSLLLNDAEIHQRQRKLVGPPLRRDEILGELPGIRDLASRTAAAWPVGCPFNPRSTLHEFAFQVIVHLLFRDLESETSRALISAYRDTVLSQLGSWSPWQRFSRMQPQIRQQLSREIEIRRQDPAPAGIMTALALGRDSDGAPISNEEIEDHVFSLLVAGVDTTAIALSWALYWLTREAGAARRLWAEIEPEGQHLDAASLFKLPYLHGVFCETLRMFPIVPTPSGRRLTVATTIGDHVFAAGTTLLPCTYLVHRREDLYPESDRFRPERFLDHRFATYEYFPFGGGLRTCVGEMLSQFEFKIALVAFLSRWELECHEPFSAAATVVPIRHGTLLAPPEDFQISLQLRSATPSTAEPNSR